MRKVIIIGCLLFSTIAGAQYEADIDVARCFKFVKRDTLPADTLPVIFRHTLYSPTQVSVTGNIGVGYANITVVGVRPFARPAVEFTTSALEDCLPLAWTTDTLLCREPGRYIYVVIYYRGLNPGGVDTGHVTWRTYHVAVDSGTVIPAVYPDSVTINVPVRADSILPQIVAGFAVQPTWAARTYHAFTLRRIATDPSDTYANSVYIGSIGLWYWRYR